MAGALSSDSDIEKTSSNDETTLKKLIKELGPKYKSMQARINIFVNDEEKLYKTYIDSLSDSFNPILVKKMEDVFWSYNTYLKDEKKHNNHAIDLTYENYLNEEYFIAYTIFMRYLTKISYTLKI
jgi:hypothetical protein